MAILPILSHRSMVCDPFCDYLNLTSPKDNGDLILSALAPLIDAVGASQVDKGLFLLPGKSGSFKYHPRGKVAIFGASGGFLDALRRNVLFSDYLAVFASFPHRVSMLHATADFMVDGPDTIQAAKLAGQSGEVSLTRKRVAPGQVKSLLSLDVDGRETGTVYYGDRKNADVWAKIYDKRHERLCRGAVDPGHRVRVEVAVQSDVGATLRDAFDPRSLFFKFASPSLVSLPDGQSDWVPHGEGYALDGSRLELTGHQRLQSIIDFSYDVSRLVRVAREEFGDGASAVLSDLIAKRFLLGSL